MANWLRRRAMGVFSLAAVLACLGVQGLTADAREPQVPPGRDPGGTAVALIGRGVDYRDPALAARLARDGEGLVIAWDVARNAHLPFAGTGTGDDRLAAIVLAEGQATRLVAVRLPVGVAASLVQGLQFVSATPARIAVLLPDLKAPIPVSRLDDASRRLAHLLLVVPARLVDPGQRDVASGLLVVAGDSDQPPTLPTGGVGAAQAAAGLDLRVGLMARQGSATQVARSAGVHGDDVAAARVAALAARLIAVEPGLLTGAALKARVLSLAENRGGQRVIDRVERIHWLE